MDYSKIEAILGYKLNVQNGKVFLNKEALAKINSKLNGGTATNLNSLSFQLQSLKNSVNKLVTGVKSTKEQILKNSEKIAEGKQRIYNERLRIGRGF